MLLVASTGSQAWSIAQVSQRNLLSNTYDIMSNESIIRSETLCTYSYTPVLFHLLTLDTVVLHVIILYGILCVCTCLHDAHLSLSQIFCGRLALCWSWYGCLRTQRLFCMSCIRRRAAICLTRRCRNPPRGWYSTTRERAWKRWQDALESMVRKLTGKRAKKLEEKRTLREKGAAHE